MPTTKEEKLLASIDGTFKDILKELKKKNNSVMKIDSKEFAKAVTPEITRYQDAQKAMQQIGSR